MIPYANLEYVTCPTGLVLPKDLAEQRYFPRRPIMVELFYGCGGFGLGFIEAGFEVVAASDWDVPAAVTYMVNMCRYGEFTIHFIEDSDRERLEKYPHYSLWFRGHGCDRSSEASCGEERQIAAAVCGGDWSACHVYATLSRLHGPALIWDHVGPVGPPRAQRLVVATGVMEPRPREELPRDGMMGLVNLLSVEVLTRPEGVSAANRARRLFTSVGN